MGPQINRKEYWEWIERIWNRPVDVTERLVFADWLEEQGCWRAAKSQRTAATIIQEAYCIYRWKDVSHAAVMHADRVAQTKYYTTKVIGIRLVNKGLDKQYFEIKRDGRVVLDPSDVDYTRGKGFGSEKHLLKGTPLTKREKKFRKVNIHGAITGRWSGRNPNSENIVREISDIEGDGDFANRLHPNFRFNVNLRPPEDSSDRLRRGTVDAISADYQAIELKSETLWQSNLRNKEANLMAHQRQTLDEIMKLPKEARFAYLYGKIPEIEKQSEGTTGTLPPIESMAMMPKHGVISEKDVKDELNSLDNLVTNNSWNHSDCIKKDGEQHETVPGSNKESDS